MKNFITRALTGIVFVAVLVSAIYIHSYYFLVVFGLITGLTLWEFYGLTLSQTQSCLNRLFCTLGGTYLFAATFCYTHDLTDRWIFLPYLVFLLATLITPLYEKGGDPLKRWTVTFFGQFYCAGSFSLLNLLTSVTGYPGEVVHIPYFALALFVLIWLNDTGAYCIGSLVGKHRLFERISPKKSWEGFMGGLLFALLASQVFAYLLPAYSAMQWLGLAAVVVVFGTWGDLIESLLKRQLGIKDSGHMLPGHGGMLDRFDSVLLAIPAAYIYIELFIRN